MEESSFILESLIKYEPPPAGSNLALEMLSAFKRHADRTLLVDVEGHREWTGAKLLDQLGRIATGLIKQVGVRPNDVLFTMCDHSGDEVLLALGSILAGCALFGSAHDGYEEERSLCELVKPNVIVTSSDSHKVAMKLKRNLEGLESTHVIWIDNPTKTTISIGRDDNNNNNNNDDPTYYEHLLNRDHVTLFEDLLKEPIDLELLNRVANQRIRASEHNVIYMLTSGSTGHPKVVPTNHEAFLHSIYSMFSSCRNPISLGADDSTSFEDRLIMPISEQSVLAGDLPLDHGAGINTMFLSLLLGSKFIVMPSYKAEVFWQSVSDHRITTSIASTTFTYKLLLTLKALIDSGQTNKWDLSSFKLLSCAGSKLAFTDLIREVNSVYKHMSLRQCYGATEVGFMCMLTGSDCKTHLDSVGHLFAGLRAKVVDLRTGEPVAAGQRGQLLVKSKGLFSEYRCREPEDPATLFARCHDSDGFYCTGDEAHYDAQQRIYIHGRIKDTLFLAEDWKIMPAELESVVDRHPLVLMSAVIGIPDAQLPGCDAPRAFVKLIPRDSKRLEQLDEAQLRERFLANDHAFIAHHIYQFAAARTAPPKHLKGGVRILDQFPTVGLLNKVDRKALKQMQ